MFVRSLDATGEPGDGLEPMSKQPPIIVPVHTPKVDELIQIGDCKYQIVRFTPRELHTGYTADNLPGDLERFHGAEIVGWASVELDDGTTVLPALLVRRHRPFVPFGADLLPLNRECARTFAIVMVAGKAPFTVFEVT